MQKTVHTDSRFGRSRQEPAALDVSWSDYLMVRLITCEPVTT